MKKSIFVEIVRLLTVLVFTVGGGALGIAYGAENSGFLLGACLGYVAGGVLGRFLRSATGGVEARTDHISAGELIAGGMGALLAGMLAALLSIPAIALLPNLWGWPVFCLFIWIGVNAGFRIMRRKTPELLSIAGLSDFSLVSGDATPTRDAILIDTSVLVDSRFLRVSRTGFLHSNLLVPKFILDELHGLTESHEQPLRRKARGGLESLKAIRRDGLLHIHVLDDEIPELEDVDAKLVALASRLAVPLLTNDESLSRVAELRGTRCLNLHRLARSLSSVIAPGELVNLSIVKEGRNEGEGVGFLDEGSMVVVANASSEVGRDVDASITTSVRTPQGRIFFASLAEG